MSETARNPRDERKWVRSSLRRLSYVGNKKKESINNFRPNGQT